MSKEIMQQASWALKDLIAVYPETACIEIRINAQKVIAALERELAKPKQELDYPPECTTPEMELAYAAGWWKALEVQRQQALDKKADNARDLGLDYEPESEPVKDWIASHDDICALLRQAHDVLALTSYPPQRRWVSLTDEDIQNVWDGMKSAVCLDHKTFARAIEAKLREKST